MKILVTGSEGYLGVPLTQALFNSGYNVVGLDTGFYRSAWLYNGIKKLPQVLSKDIRQVTEVDLLGYDAVVHLAELSNDSLGQINQQVTFQINHQGTVNLIKICKMVGIKRFIYFSSCSVYGASEKFVDEDTKTFPLTPYAHCKILNEKFFLEQASDDFSPVILRLATAFGPSPRMRFDLAVNNLTGLAFTTKELKLESDGSAWRPFVHVEDICQAVATILAQPRQLTHNQIFNVGSSVSNYRIREVAKTIAEIIPGCRITFNKKVIDARNYRVNFDKIHRLLPGFACQRDIPKGIEELYQLFQVVDLQKEIFEAKEYSRLKQITYLHKSKQIDDNFYWQK